MNEEQVFQLLNTTVKEDPKKQVNNSLKGIVRNDGYSSYLTALASRSPILVQRCLPINYAHLLHC